MSTGSLTHQALFALGAGAATFVSTNIDGAAVLTPALWISGGAGHRYRYIAGCTAGNMVVLAAAVLAATGLTRLPGTYTAWLGVIPILIGLLNILRTPTTTLRPQAIPSASTGMLITCSLGVDNTLVLAPIIRSFGGWAGLLVLTHLLLFPASLLLVARARPRWVVRGPTSHAGGYLTIAVGTLLIGRQLI